MGVLMGRELGSGDFAKSKAAVRQKRYREKVKEELQKYRQMLLPKKERGKMIKGVVDVQESG